MEEKTLTTTPFLNTRLKPLETDSGNAYPVYIRVIYDKKNTTLPVYSLKSFDEKDLYVTPKEYEIINEEIIRYRELIESQEGVDWKTGIIIYFLDDLQKILEHEIAWMKNKFMLRGLGKRVEFLYSSMLDYLGNKLNTSLKYFLFESEVYHDFHHQILLKRSFLENYSEVESPLLDRFIKISPQLKYEIEYYFLIAAFSQTGRANMQSFLLEEGVNKFKAFLSQEQLYNPDIELKVPLRNQYARHLSLNAPTKPKAFYINKLEEDIKYINEKYSKLLG